MSIFLYALATALGVALLHTAIIILIKFINP